MSWPFLGQHNFPYQQDYLWLNLEERALSQLGLRLVSGAGWNNQKGDAGQ
jgi:hypothetical protein